METRDAFDVRLKEISDGFDDYEIRMADSKGQGVDPSPLDDAIAAVRACAPGTGRLLHPAASGLRVFGSVRHNGSTAPEDGVLISEIDTSCGPLIAAFYCDKVQLIEPGGWTQLVVMDLPVPFRQRRKTRARKSYDDAWSWRLSEDLRPLPA